MNYRELSNQLADKIELLNEEFRETERTISILNKDKKRVIRLLGENLDAIMAEARSVLAMKPEDMPQFFEGLDPEKRKALASVERIVSSSLREIESLKADLPNLDTVEALEDKLSRSQEKLEVLEESYTENLDVMRLCNMDPLLLEYANEFASQWGNSGETLYEAMRTEGSFRKTIRHLFGGGNKEASRYFDLYRNREGTVSGLAYQLDIRSADPLALRTKSKRAEKSVKKTKDQIKSIYGTINKTKAQIHKRRAAERAMDDDANAERVFMALEQEATMSDKSYLALGDMTNTELRMDIDTTEIKSWDHSAYWELQAKLNGTQALLDHSKTLLKAIKNTAESLRRANAKISSKMHKIGHKRVTRFDWSNPEQSINKLVGQAKLSNEWFRKNHEALNNGQYGGFGDNLLLWTAVYLTFSGDANAAEFGESANQAALEFKETLQADSIMAGDVNVTDSLGGLGSDISMVDSLPSSLSALGGLDSIGSSLDSSISSMTSSIDSSVSSFSSSSFDSGGFSGGGF